MIIETVQWNIGGGLIRKSDALLDEPESYKTDGLDYIIQELEERFPHIITLQEVQSRGTSFNQAAEIARKLRYDLQYFPLSPSHFKEGNELGVALLSQFPLWFPSGRKFRNPHWTQTQPNGQVYESHDKGVLSAVARVSDRGRLLVKSTHLVPAHLFGQDLTSPENAELLKDINEKLAPDMKKNPWILIQGDFNIDAIRLREIQAYAEQLIPDGMQEVPTHTPTLYVGNKSVDHVLFGGIAPASHRGQRTQYYRPTIADAKTDHRYVICHFEVADDPPSTAPTRPATRSVLLPLHRLRQGRPPRSSEV